MLLARPQAQYPGCKAAEDQPRSSLCKEASEVLKPILAPLERHVADEVRQLSNLYPELFPPSDRPPDPVQSGQGS